MKKVHVLIVILVGLIAGGCITVTHSKNGFEKLGKPKLEKMAAFDLGCTPEKLSYLPMGDQSDGYDKVGVSGCGKKVQYANTHESGWVKTSETTH